MASVYKPPISSGCLLLKLKSTNHDKLRQHGEIKLTNPANKEK